MGYKMTTENTAAAAPARKQQRRSIVTQQKLLEAAIEAFSESGFNGTSTRDIAERAGVHHPLITYHFKNKDQLWKAAADHVFNAFRHALAASFEASQVLDPKERMARMIRAYVYHAKSHPELIKVIVLESSFPNPRLDWLIEKHLRPFFDASFEIMKELQELGVAPAGNPNILFNMIRVASGGLLAISNELKTSSDIDTDDSAVLDEIADITIQLFLPGEPRSPAAANGNSDDGA